MMKKIAAGAAVLLMSLVSALPSQADVLRLGISAPLSGPSAGWGVGADWVGKQAVAAINAAGGIKVGDKTYTLEITTYENAYTAAESTKSAQAMLNRDGVRYIVNSFGTAATKALQSLSERSGAMLFTTAWGRSLKGPQFPLTFTNVNTPVEFFGPLYAKVQQDHPAIKTVVLLNPNDATGKEAEQEALARWKELGVEVVASTFYERGTTEFQPIATKLAQLKADSVDLCSTAPADAGAVFRELAVQGWSGIKVYGAGSGPDALMRVGGDSVEGVYMANAADYAAASSTEIQRQLDAEGRKVLGEPLNTLHMGTWDAIFALKAGIEKAGSIEPAEVAKVLPGLVFDSSYGPAVFGRADVYGSAQQILIPVIITQLHDGKVIELVRVDSPELKQRLAEHAQ